MLKINFKLIFRSVPVRCLLLPLVLTCVATCVKTTPAPSSYRGTIKLTVKNNSFNNYRTWVYVTTDVVFISHPDEEDDLFGGLRYSMFAGTMKMTTTGSFGACTIDGKGEYKLANTPGDLFLNRSNKGKSYSSIDIPLTTPQMVTETCEWPFPPYTGSEPTNDFIRIETSPNGHLVGEEKNPDETRTLVWDLVPVD